MIEDLLYQIEDLVPAGLTERATALARWQPSLSGAMNIRIDSDGIWHHDGRPIRRQSLVRLLASVLRREDDGAYYLVTPAEKWRIGVDELPLLVVDCMLMPGTAPTFQLNLGYPVTAAEHPPLRMHCLRDGGKIPSLPLPNGLAALFSRAAWYRLAEQLELQGGFYGVRNNAEQFIALYSAGADR